MIIRKKDLNILPINYSIMSRTRKEMNKLPRYVKPTTEGKCPYCHNQVKSLENHIHDEHKGKKIVKRR